MKKSEIQELKKKPVAELINLLAEKREALRALKADLAMGKSAQIKEIRELGKTVARINTHLNAS
ncbi:MAG: 50S ribosomal protein L29 [bacterium]|nr:50S ribosomal protein L29 [bacterium]